MNAPDVSLIEMLQMAETPLYSVYCVLDDDFDGNLPLALDFVRATLESPDSPS